MLVSLKEILKNDQTVLGFNVFGYEDSMAVIKAAEELNMPVILMTNKDAVNFMPIEMFGLMLGKLAKDSKVPVCVHLDHSTSMEDIERAINAGYTSVMFDGSQLEFEENVSKTQAVVEIAHKHNVSVEAEIGAVGYSDPRVKARAIYTDPCEAAEFAVKTEVDALAVAIGTVHRMVMQEARIDYDLLKRINEKVDIPLVIHGASGAKDEDIVRMCKNGVGKINFGTTLRMAFGKTLRQVIETEKEEFDRLKLFVKPIEAVKEKAKEKMLLTVVEENR